MEIEAHQAVELCGPRIEHDFASTGGSALLSDGRVLIGYSGPSNPHDAAMGETRIYARESCDGCKTWSAEREIVHHPECKAIGPTLCRMRDGSLWMFYLGFYRHAWPDGEPDMQATRSDVWAARSSDDGRTWTDRQMIFRGYSGATNGAIQTASA